VASSGQNHAGGIHDVHNVGQNDKIIAVSGKDVSAGFRHDRDILGIPPFPANQSIHFGCIAWNCT
jgi:hypothetical protein